MIDRLPKTAADAALATVNAEAGIAEPPLRVAAIAEVGAGYRFN